MMREVVEYTMLMRQVEDGGRRGTGKWLMGKKMESMIGKLLIGEVEDRGRR